MRRITVGLMVWFFRVSLSLMAVEGVVALAQSSPAESPAGQSSGLDMSGVESFIEPYQYDPKGRRDPFRPYAEAKGPAEGELSGPLLPLQRFDLDQLNLSGIIWDVSDPKAMFIDPNGQIHIVRKDERLGRRNGYIAVIREGEVVVVETLNINGELMYSTRVLRIGGGQGNTRAN